MRGTKIRIIHSEILKVRWKRTHGTNDTLESVRRPDVSGSTAGPSNRKLRLQTFSQRLIVNRGSEISFMLILYCIYKMPTSEEDFRCTKVTVAVMNMFKQEVIQNRSLHHRLISVTRYCTFLICKLFVWFDERSNKKNDRSKDFIFLFTDNTNTKKS